MGEAAPMTSRPLGRNKKRCLTYPLGEHSKSKKTKASLKWSQRQFPQAESDHTKAESDHTIAESDHTKAESERTKAETDHTKAEPDLTKAEPEHTKAESDHTKAELKHTQNRKNGHDLSKNRGPALRVGVKCSLFWGACQVGFLIFKKSPYFFIGS